MSGNQTLIDLGSVLVRIGQELMKEGQPSAGGASKQPDPTPKETAPTPPPETTPATTQTPPADTGDGPSRTIPVDPTAEDIRACFAHLMQHFKPQGEEAGKRVAAVVGRIGKHMECAKLSNLQKPEKKVQAIRYGLFLYDTAKAGGLDAVLNVKFPFEGGPELDTTLYPLPSGAVVDNSPGNSVEDYV